MPCMLEYIRMKAYTYYSLNRRAMDNRDAGRSSRLSNVDSP